jgi:TolB protein
VQVTNDVDGYSDEALSTTVDGKSASALLLDSEFRLSVVTLAADPGRAVDLTSGRNDGARGICWTPDNRLVFEPSIRGAAGLWDVALDGSQRRQLTNESDSFPAASPDGRFLVFVSQRSGYFNLWRADLDGGNPTQLTQGNAEDTRPAITPDGKWVVFQSFRSGAATLWKVPIEGGDPVQLTTVSSVEPTISADGKTILCVYNDERSEPHRIVMAILPFDGGDPIRTVDVPSNLGSFPKLSADGRSILYIGRDDDVDNVWSVPIDGGKPKQVTRFTSGHISKFAVSPDGKRLALARGTESADAVLIKDFK